MRTGQYDIVSASGDAALRLIVGGDVQPLNIELIPNFSDEIAAGMRNNIYDTVNGKPYGVPIGRGANLLQYNDDVTKGDEVQRVPRWCKLRVRFKVTDPCPLWDSSRVPRWSKLKVRHVYLPVCEAMAHLRDAAGGWQPRGAAHGKEATAALVGLF